MKFIGEKLKHLRETMGWSLVDIADMTGMKTGHISDIENNKRNPRPATVKKLCSGLNIDERYFYLEDSKLPVDVLPDMPENLEKFIAQPENIPWLKVTEKAKQGGISIEALDTLVSVLIQQQETKRKD